MAQAPVSDTSAMIAGMDPVERPGRYVFVDSRDRDLAARAFAIIREDEGTTLILPQDIAQAAGLDTSFPMACITLNIRSALAGIGLTAAVATALAGAGISCNVLAAFHHDHIFVPADRAAEAVAILAARAARERN